MKCVHAMDGFGRAQGKNPNKLRITASNKFCPT
jgi:hypothetical protein